IAIAERRWHRAGLTAARAGSNPSPLVPTEDEQLVLDNRPAKRAAGLVALQAVRKPGEETVSVELGVADVPEGVAVNLVGPALGHDVDRPRGASSHLHPGVAGDHAELLHRIGKWKRQVGVEEIVAVVAAIESVLQVVLARAVDREGFDAGGR